VVMVLALLLLLLSLATARAAHGEVPTAADFVACNGQAPDAARTGSAMPTMSDHARADRARAGGMTTIRRCARGRQGECSR
jgi:hypothetical protein